MIRASIRAPGLIRAGMVGMVDTIGLRPLRRISLLHDARVQAVALTGSAAGQGSVTGEMQATKAMGLGGEASGLGAASGVTVRLLDLLGTAQGLAAAVAEARRDSILAGAADGQGEAFGAGERLAALAGAASGQGVVAGSLARGAPLAGTAAGQGSATASPTLAAPVAQPVIFDPATKNANLVLSNGNLSVLKVNTDNHAAARSSISVAGNRYVEIRIDAAASPSFSSLGVTGAFNNAAHVGNQGIAWLNDGYRKGNTVIASGKPQLGNGDLAMIAVELAAERIWFGRNGVWNEGSPAAGTGGTSFADLVGPYFFAVSLFSLTGEQMTVNFGAAAFVYPPPSGFRAWNAA